MPPCQEQEAQSSRWEALHDVALLPGLLLSRLVGALGAGGCWLVAGWWLVGGWLVAGWWLVVG